MNHTLKEQDRTRDIYVVGAKQLGKTTFLLNCVIQDILLGKGVAFLDPHGDAAEELLKLIPKSRIADTIYFDPLRYTIPINLFGTRDEDQIHKITDDVIYIFRRFSGGDWGVRMDTVTRHVLHTLLKLKTSTFLDPQEAGCSRNGRKIVRGVRSGSKVETGSSPGSAAAGGN